MVKPEYLDLAYKIFKNTGITPEGKCHLGASIGSQSFTTKFVKDGAIMDFIFTGSK